MISSLPDNLQLGDTWVWDAAVADYPSDTWVLKFTLRGYGLSVIDITATAAAEGGDNYDVELGAYYTKDYLPGTYSWTAFVEKGVGAARERYTVGQGSVSLLANLEAATGATDVRSHARKVLDAVEAAIEGRASKAQASITVNGKAVAYMKHEELIRLRSQYRREVNREKGISSTIYEQFGSYR